MRVNEPLFGNEKASLEAKCCLLLLIRCITFSCDAIQLSFIIVDSVSVQYCSRCILWPVVHR